MTNRTYILAFFGLFVFLPVIAINVWNFSLSPWVNQVSHYNAILRNQETTAALASAKSPPPSAGVATRTKLRNVFSQDKLNSNRSVSLLLYVDINEMLKEGEEQPQDVYLALYAEARAPQYMNQFCIEILATVGTKCIVATTSATVVSGGTLRISGELNYVPSYHLGLPEKQNGAKLMQAEVGVSILNKGLLPINNSKNRAAYLNRAKSICEGLKAQYGNCVITNISLKTNMLSADQIKDLSDGTNAERLDAHIGLSVFAPETEESYAAFQERVRELASVF